MAIEFVSHRFDTKLKKRIEEKVKAKPRIINLQGDTSIAPEVKQKEQKIIQSVQDSKKREV